jgi:hypothetical protein
MQRNASDVVSVTDALWACPARAATEGENAQEWRATETVLAPPGDGTTLWPYGPPGRRPCGLPVRCRTVGEHGPSWVIRHVSVKRAGAPGPIPPWPRAALGAPTSRPRSPSNRARQPGWLAGESPREPIGQPKHAFPPMRPANRRTPRPVDRPSRGVRALDVNGPGVLPAGAVRSAQH